MSDKQLHEMSDEELMNVDLSALVLDEPQTQAQEADVNAPMTANIEQAEQVEQTQTGQDEQPVNEPVSGEVVTDPETQDAANTAQNQEEHASDEVVDTQVFYDILTKPFKANGREITIKDPNDMITLMQKGVDYSKKMEALKPQKAIIKTLEQHGLLDNDKLAYLIDLHNKDPKAIAKLVKESEIDLYSFDTEQAESYQPQQVITPVSELQEVVDELYSHDSFRRVLSDMTSTWDNKSKEVISNNPEVLRVFNQHAQLGVYDKVVQLVEHERMLGRMTNMPFIEAYIAMEQQVTKPMAQQNQTANQQSFTAPRPVTPKTTESSSDKIKATTPNKSNGATGAIVDLTKLTDSELAEYLKQQHNLN